MQRHAERGHSLLSQIPDFFEGAAFVLAHHERQDGAGYPRGLRGEEIPIEVSVIAVADTYDAMTTDWPHRKALGWEQVKVELLRERGTPWDARAVDAFVEMMEEERSAPPAGGRARVLTTA